MLLKRARLLIACLWAGSLWTVGYLVAPTLFATLSDRVLAGSIAASMFRAEAWLSIACALALLLLLRWGMEEKQGRVLSRIALAMLACTLLSHFGLQPQMAALREAAGAGGVMEGAGKARFGALHGVSSVIFLIQSLLAGWLIARQ